MKKILSITCMLLATALLLTACNTTEPTPPSTAAEINPTTTPPLKEVQLTPEAPLAPQLLSLEGGTVFSNTNGVKTALFKNVPSHVTDVRVGTDGSTIHFKRSTDKGQGCANPNGTIEVPNADYKNPPPLNAPWNYEKIGYYGTIESCGGSGYLMYAPYFATIVSAPDNTLTLTLEPLNATVTKKTITLDPRIEAGFKATIGQETAIVHNGSTYFYPNEDAYDTTSGRLLLSIGEGILLVDTQSATVIGFKTFDDLFNTIPAYFFESHAGSPIIMLGISWEGSMYVGTIDMSAQTLTANKFDNKLASNLPVWYPRESGPAVYEWKGKNLVLHQYIYQDISKRLTDEESKKVFDVQASDDTVLRTVEARLNEKNEFAKVVCTFPGMEGGGCLGYTKGADIVISPQK